MTEKLITSHNSTFNMIKSRKAPANYKAHFRKHNKKRFLEAGQRGFLATCNFREKECVRECYNILNEYAEDLYGGPLHVSEPDVSVSLAEEESADISDQLQSEINSTDNGRESRYGFSVVDTGASNCVFIKTDLPNPIELGQHIVSDIIRTKIQKTRFLLRLLPIAAVCRANSNDILKTAGYLCDTYFLKQGCTYSIVINKRYNNNIKRDDIIKVLAELVQSKNAHNKVDLKKPEKSLVLEIIKGLCCITVLEDYFKYKKFNLFELADVKTEEAECSSRHGKEGEEAEPDSALASTETMDVSNKGQLITEKLSPTCDFPDVPNTKTMIGHLDFHSKETTGP